MMVSFRSWPALLRSIMVYHGDRARHRSMDALYAQFVKSGDLAFDIGAHVGDRIASFRRLGARVIALEPQPGPALVLQLLFGHDRTITLLRKAAAGTEGELTPPQFAEPHRFDISDTRQCCSGAQNWEGQRWDGAITVPSDARCLIDTLATHLLRIDVEVTSKSPIRPDDTCSALSFEFSDARSCDRILMPERSALPLQCFCR